MIVFENRGVIPVEAFTTFGLNAKPNTENPIGYFGTGLKYAVAVTLRLGGSFRLFRGDEEYEFYTKIEDFRGTEFSMIRMKKRKGLFGRWSYDRLPFTTELGKDWKPWMAVREIESNTRDEIGRSYVTDAPASVDINSSGNTKIVIDCPEMETSYTEEEIFLKIDESVLFESRGIKVYEKASRHLWYRGLRVVDLEYPSMYTYEFIDKVDLTEDRTLKYYHYEIQNITRALASCDDISVVSRIMDNQNENVFEFGLGFDQVYSNPSPTFLAGMGDRISKGSYLPKRITSLYRTLYPEPNPDEMVTIALRLSKWQEIRTALEDGGHDELAKRIAIEFNQQEIPF